MLIQRVNLFAAVLRRAAQYPTRLTFTGSSALMPKGTAQAEFFLEGETVCYSEFIKHFADLLGAYLRGETQLQTADALAPQDDVKIDFRYLVWSSIKKMSEPEAEKLFEAHNYVVGRPPDAMRTPGFITRDMSDNITFLHFYYSPKTMERLFVSYPRASVTSGDQTQPSNRYSFYRSLLCLSMLGYLELRLENQPALPRTSSAPAITSADLSASPAAATVQKKNGLQKILAALTGF